MSDVVWDLSLRAEQPVESCELSPHAYIKVKSLMLDNPGKAKVFPLSHAFFLLLELRSLRPTLIFFLFNGVEAPKCKCVKIQIAREKRPVIPLIGQGSLEGVQHFDAQSAKKLEFRDTKPYFVQ
jgi:hypothetical protein